MDSLSTRLAARCAADGEFRLAARYWTGSLRFDLGETVACLLLSNGEVRAAEALPATVPVEAGHIGVRAAAEVWSKILAPIPPPFFNDLPPAQAFGVVREGDVETSWQYYPAARRVVDLREEGLRCVRPVRSPIGRYVHLDSTASTTASTSRRRGSGIPLLLQHTAGAHGAPVAPPVRGPEITDRFRLIAYDLPYHGKSLPPGDDAVVGERYVLPGEFLMQVPVALAERTRPGAARVHGLLGRGAARARPRPLPPRRFRAVIAARGRARTSSGDPGRLGIWHPQSATRPRRRMMYELMAPTPPRPTATRRRSSTARVAADVQGRPATTTSSTTTCRTRPTGSTPTSARSTC